MFDVPSNLCHRDNSCRSPNCLAAEPRLTFLPFRFAILVSVIGVPEPPSSLILTCWRPANPKSGYLSAGGVVASILVVICLLWLGVVDQVGFHPSGTIIDLANLPFALGIYSFCYSGHSVFPNIYSSMKEPSKFPWVLVAAYFHWICHPVLFVTNCDLLVMFLLQFMQHGLSFYHLHCCISMRISDVRGQDQVSVHLKHAPTIYGNKSSDLDNGEFRNPSMKKKVLLQMHNLGTTGQWHSDNIKLNCYLSFFKFFFLLQVVNPMTKYALTIMPVALSLEELLPSSHRKSYGLALIIRSVLVMSILIVALAVPFFGRNLIALDKHIIFLLFLGLLICLTEYKLRKQQI